jgi:polyisoprenoid-binding protein YceI
MQRVRVSLFFVAVAVSFAGLRASADVVVPPAAVPAAPAPAAPAAPAPDATTRTWRIDPARSSVVIQVFKDGVAARFAHDHVVAAHQFAGTITGVAGDPTTARVEVTAQTASFVNDEPALRAQFKLPLEVSEGDRKTIEASMKGPEVLDVAHFPTVSFRSTSVERSGGALTLKGALTLHGVTRTVAMPLDVKVDGDVVDGRASFRVKTSDYGMPPYAALFGAVKCKDEIALHLHLVGIAAKP